METQIFTIRFFAACAAALLLSNCFAAERQPLLSPDSARASVVRQSEPCGEELRRIKEHERNNHGMIEANDQLRRDNAALRNEVEKLKKLLAAKERGE